MQTQQTSVVVENLISSVLSEFLDEDGGLKKAKQIATACVICEPPDPPPPPPPTCFNCFIFFPEG